MSKSSSAKQAIFREPHPLARALLERIAPGSSVLELGAGSGRNLAALIGTMAVVAVESDHARADALRVDFDASNPEIICFSSAGMPLGDQFFSAVLSTHALLHGMPNALQTTLREVGRVMKPAALLFAAFGSESDERFGQGDRRGPHSFVSSEGDEAGIVHSFFREAALRELLHDFEIEDINKVAVDDIAGTWAHAQRPLRGAVHWFVVARKRR